MTDRLISTATAAKILNVSDETVRRWVERGRLRATIPNIGPSGRKTIKVYHTSVIRLLEIDKIHHVTA